MPRFSPDSHIPTFDEYERRFSRSHSHTSTTTLSILDDTPDPDKLPSDIFDDSDFDTDSSLVGAGRFRGV